MMKLAQLGNLTVEPLKELGKLLNGEIRMDLENWLFNDSKF